MSRLTDALLVLLGKCTPEGTKPEGDKVCDIVECLAGNFSLTDYVLENRVSTEKFLEAVSAFENGGASLIWNGKRVTLAKRNGDYVSVRYAEAPFINYVYSVATETVTSEAASKYYYDQSHLTVNVNADGDTITSADRTYAEILTAYNAGRTVIVNLHGSIFNMCFVGSTYFRFSRVFVKSTYADISGLMVSNDNTWTYDVHEIFNNETT